MLREEIDARGSGANVSTEECRSNCLEVGGEAINIRKKGECGEDRCQILPADRPLVRKLYVRRGQGRCLEAGMRRGRPDRNQVHSGRPFGVLDLNGFSLKKRLS